MKQKENNYAYIDGANLHKGVISLGWKLDYARFRVWLSEKYGVSRAYLFIGMIPKHNVRGFLQIKTKEGKEKAPSADKTA